ncbi:DUF4190 domain-containing protein [Mycetocola spongiae]|uniref:DUF4190 domain-containing protein n=1 Tax=Mycetocola spongiae TaxID=2859226 RepID=UPI001CF267ED|nr:DUF4190 domain-containing protein [Mycetocola spongiae]UCR88805.1 DUF4190 domain-containing protein [Mycetocola spongiae]
MTDSQPTPENPDASVPGAGDPAHQQFVAPEAGPTDYSTPNYGESGSSPTAGAPMAPPVPGAEMPAPGNGAPGYGAPAYGAEAPGYGAPAYGAPTYPAGQAGPSSGRSPASGFDITAFVLSILAPLVGLIMGIVATSRARREQRRASGMAAASVWVGAILTAGWIVFSVVMVIVVIAGTAFVSSSVIASLPTNLPTSLPTTSLPRVAPSDETMERFCDAYPVLASDFPALDALNIMELAERPEGAASEEIALLERVSTNSDDLFMISPTDIEDPLLDLTSHSESIARALSNGYSLDASDFTGLARDQRDVVSYVAANCG